MLELRYSDYLNRVHGGWIGKCIGGAVGAKQENNKNLMNYTLDNIFPDVIPPNDDLDLQVLWLQEVLEKKGASFTSKDLACAFAKYNLCLANEYGVAIKNIQRGIFPPVSGTFNNHYFKNSMGCPIRSEIWGFTCPGNPQTAAYFAYLDGSIDHGPESIYGEQFYAAIEANAFFEQDLMKLIEGGLEFVPEDTELYRCITFVVEQYLDNVPWQTTRERLVRSFGSADASYSVVNIGITVMALLYGEGDFTDTMLIAVNSGYDTDCTAATAGAILGEILGAHKIPEFWLDKIGKNLVIGTVQIKRYSDSILDLAKDTCAAGLSFARDGVISISITDIPDDVKPSLPVMVESPPVKIEIEYLTKPSVGVDEPATVAIIVKNNSDFARAGKVVITAPDSLQQSVEEIGVNIFQHSEINVEVEFYVRKDVSVLPQTNIITVAYQEGEQVIAKEQFGLAGASRMKVIGPFWDNYDTRVHDEDPYGDERQRTPEGHADLRAMFNSFVNIHRQYIDESFKDLDELHGVYADFHEDKLNLDDVIGYKGPCCVYLVYDFVCPEERKNVVLHVGNSDPFKIWLNGDLVHQAEGHTMWMPFNNSVGGLHLRAGVNRMVIKVVRSNDRFGFSFHMTSGANLWRWFVDLASVVENAEEEK